MAFNISRQFSNSAAELILCGLPKNSFEESGSAGFTLIPVAASGNQADTFMLALQAIY